MMAYGNGMCGVSPMPGAVNMPKGFKVEVLDEMDPAGSVLSDFVETTSAPVVQPPGVSPTTTVATISTGECPCSEAQYGKKGCCDGRSAICDWISNVPKLLGEQRLKQAA